VFSALFFGRSIYWWGEGRQREREIERLTRFWSYRRTAPCTLDRFFKLAMRSRISITSHDARMTPRQKTHVSPSTFAFTAGRLLYFFAALPAVLALLADGFTTVTCADLVVWGGWHWKSHSGRHLHCSWRWQPGRDDAPSSAQSWLINTRFDLWYFEDCPSAPTDPHHSRTAALLCVRFHLLLFKTDVVALSLLTCPLILYFVPFLTKI
jgi:hypothetical protein